MFAIGGIIVEKVKEIEWVQVAAGLIDGFASSVETVIDKMGELWEGLKDAVKEQFDNIWPLLPDWFTEGIESVYNLVVKAFTDLADSAIGDFIATAKKGLDDFWTLIFGEDTQSDDTLDFFDKIAKGVKGVADDILNSDLLAGVQEFVGDIADSVSNIDWDSIVDTVKSVLSDIGDVITAAFEAIDWDKVKSILSRSGDSIGKVFVRAIKEGIERGSGKLEKVLVGSVENAFKDIKTKFDELSSHLETPLFASLESGVGSTVKIISSLTRSMETATKAAQTLEKALRTLAKARSAAGGGGGASSPEAPLGYRAMGGPIEIGKTYLVGERGPELLRLKGSYGEVYQHGRTPVEVNSSSKSSRDGGLTVNQNFNIQTPDVESFELSQREIARRMRVMAREVARETGRA